MWGLKWLNINSLFGGQTLASIILSLEVDHRRLAGQVLILLIVRIDLESYRAPDGTCVSFCSSRSQEWQITIAIYTQITSQLKVEASRRQQQCWNQPGIFSSNYGDSRRLSLETIEFIVTTADCPAGHSLVFPASGKWLEGNSSSKSVSVSGTLRSCALLTSGSYLHLTSKHHMNEQLKGLPQILWEFTWRQWRYEKRYSLFPL